MSFKEWSAAQRAPIKGAPTDKPKATPTPNAPEAQTDKDPAKVSPEVAT